MKNIIAAILGASLFMFSIIVEADQPGREGYSLTIQHNPVGSKDVLLFKTHSMFGKESFGVGSEFVDDNVDVLNKFLKWAAMARERGDTVNKELDTVKGFEFGLFYYWNKYEFQTSQDSKSYHLKVTSGKKVLGFKFTPQDPDDDGSQASIERTRVMSFSEDQVKQIIQRMQDFKGGKIKTKDEVERDYK